MLIMLSSLIAIFLFLFSPIAPAETFGKKLCANDENYFCYKVKKQDSWTKLFEDPEEREIVMKVNRINKRLHPGMKIAIPYNLEDATLLDFAPFDREIEATGKKSIQVSLKNLAFGAYNEDGSLVYWGPVSGGKGYCPDIRRRCNSPQGTYSIYRKLGAGCVSSKFPVGRGGAPMPYCMFFHGGFALHGSYDVPGYNASHGCIRLFVNDAEWLNEEFTSGERKVRVTISS